ncbi:MAG: Uncharacterized protein G01um101424_186 [Parcubacteria group bacterium Gr01-1014_24]|nr:MAG: Uncharacterized protein G01um101424_186 [Parcubacteria group bacterium Gr01-1014_24]
MKQKIKRKVNHQSGAAMLISVVFFIFISLAIISGLVSSSVREFKNAQVNLNSKKSYFLAESGSEDALYRIINGITIGGSENLTLDSNSVTTTITDNLGQKGITSLGDVSSYQRKTNIKLKTGVGASFNYGVQVGQGGLEMTNSSKIIGNAYSGGNIIGTNSARIQGAAIASGPTGIIDGVDITGNSDSFTIRGNSTVGGNAKHSVLQNTTVTGNVVADSISNCTIGGTAKYDTRASCTVTGAITTPNPDVFVPADILPLPISEAQIDLWEAEAVAGGVVGTQNYSSGTRNLGPKKINGDLLLSNTAELTVTGTLWVTGEIRLSNSSILRLSPSFGGNSGMVLAGIDEDSNNGYIEISNSAQLLGSGTSGSYIMLLSQKEGVASDAIRMSNGAGAAILYAGEGKIEVNNSAALKEVTAYLLLITNNAIVTYESGLANTNFSSGPSGGYEIDSWKETE